MADLDRVVEEIRRWGYSAAGSQSATTATGRGPAPVLLEMLPPSLAGVERPALVVDLGSGTGLSTRFWAEHADAVVGVEPTPEMREVAVAATDGPDVSYRAASAHDDRPS